MSAGQKYILITESQNDIFESQNDTAKCQVSVNMLGHFYLTTINSQRDLK